MNNRHIYPLPMLLATLALAALPVRAGNPLVVDNQGRLVVWGSFPIRVIYDQGTLGNLSNSDAVNLARQIFTAWQNVSTARVTFQDAGMISQDVTATNFQNLTNCSPSSELTGKLAVIFDTDGSITDLLTSGQKSVVVGLGSAHCLSQNPQTGIWTVNSGYVVLNGFALTKTNPISQNDFESVILHEVGHALGLDHTQFNGNLRTSSNLADRANVPLMYPILTNNRPNPLGMTLDDTSEISLLYPATSFSTQPSLMGNVLLPDGQTPFQGANVVARNINDSNATAAANVSGDRFTRTSSPLDVLAGSTDQQYKGKYEFYGLPAGSYSMSVESIDTQFNRGSSVGPFGTPFPLPYGAVLGPTVALSTGNTFTQNILLASSAVLPSMANLTIIPHFAQGGGYVTRVFIKNLSTSTSSLLIQYMNQDGTIAASPSPEQVQLSSGETISRTTGEANRGTTAQSPTTQWIAIGSDQKISASVLFDCCAATTVTTATGVLPASPGGSFAVPFVYQRDGQTTIPVLVLGLALANTSTQANTITISLLDQNGSRVASDTLASLSPFGQTAFVIPDFSSTSKVPQISAYLSNVSNLTNQNSFLGSLATSSTGGLQFAPLIVGNLGSKLFSLPLTSQ